MQEPVIQSSRTYGYLRLTERRRSRTYPATGYAASPVLKTGWATGPGPLRIQRTKRKLRIYGALARRPIYRSSTSRLPRRAERVVSSGGLGDSVRHQMTVDAEGDAWVGVPGDAGDLEDARSLRNELRDRVMAEIVKAEGE